MHLANLRQRASLLTSLLLGALTMGCTEVPEHSPLIDEVSFPQARSSDPSVPSRIGAPHTREEFLALYPFFAAVGEKGIRFSGVGKITKDILIPPGLEVTFTRGSILWMDSGVSLISESPVIAEGSLEHPIQFVRAYASRPWGAFALHRAKGQSRIAHVVFEGGGSVNNDFSIPHTMVYFNKSPVTITGSTLSSAPGTLALYLNGIYVDVQGTRIGHEGIGMRIENAPAGIIRDVRVRTSGDKGVVVMSSPILLERVTVQGASEVCLAVYGRATPLLRDIELRSCHTGLGVYGDAHVKADRLFLEGNAIGIEARSVQHDLYDTPAPTVVIRNAVFIGNGQNVSQDEKSTVSIEN